MRLSVDRIRGHTFVAELVPFGGQVIDLGMNRGCFAYEIQRKYGCQVLGVEANPLLAQEIAASETLRPLNFAISPLEGEVIFHVDPANSEASSLTRPAGESQMVSVPAITLPRLLSYSGIEQIDLLKIDIEGAEIELFQSAPAASLLRTTQISVEFHAFMGKGSVQTIVEILKQLEKNGFLALDFSRTYEDVLLINRRIVPVSEMSRLWLLYQKYREGIIRVARRRWDATPDQA